MAPTSDTRKISGASGSDQQSLVKALLEGMGEGFFAFDHSWRLTASNSAAEAILGAPSAEVVGDLLWNVLPQIRGTEFERICRVVIESRTEKNSRSTRRCGLAAVTRCELFPLALTLAWRFATSPIAKETRRRSVTRKWSSLALSASEASADWTSIYRTASAVNARRNISIFTAFRQAPSTTRTSSGSRAFTRKTESALRSTFLRRSLAPIKNTRLNIASFDRATVKHDGFARSRRSSATPKVGL